MDWERGLGGGFDSRGRGVYIEEGDRAYTGVVAAGEKRFMTVVRGEASTWRRGSWCRGGEGHNRCQGIGWGLTQGWLRWEDGDL